MNLCSPLNYNFKLHLRDNNDKFREFLCDFSGTRVIFNKEVPNPLDCYYHKIGNLIFEHNAAKEILTVFGKDFSNKLYEMDYYSNFYPCLTDNNKYLIIDRNYIYEAATGKLIDKVYLPGGSYFLHGKISNNLRYHLVLSKITVNLVYKRKLTPLCLFDYYINSYFTKNSKYLVLLLKTGIKIYDCASIVEICEIAIPKCDDIFLLMSCFGRLFLSSNNDNIRSHYYLNLRKGRLELINDLNDFPDYFNMYINKDSIKTKKLIVEVKVSEKIRNEDIICKLNTKISSKNLKFNPAEIIIFELYCNGFIPPLAKIAKLLPAILILKKNLAKKYPASLPPEIVAEITYHLLQDLIIIKPSAELVAYFIESASKTKFTEEEFLEGFYQNI